MLINQNCTECSNFSYFCYRIEIIIKIPLHGACELACETLISNINYKGLVTIWRQWFKTFWSTKVWLHGHTTWNEIRYTFQLVFRKKIYILLTIFVNYFTSSFKNISTWTTGGQVEGRQFEILSVIITAKVLPCFHFNQASQTPLFCFIVNITANTKTEKTFQV